MSADGEGYAPAQIQQAYGFDHIHGSDGSTGDGSGQVIAIVDAYHNPNLLKDLSVFDNQFGLPNPSITVVNQNGGTRPPRNDPGWSQESALDVEWAHAVAPAAGILLMETASADTPNLVAGINTARHWPGVSTVSMSWGTKEFKGENRLDSTFTTPAGHGGVSFFSAAGDNGQSGGVEWPSASVNVVSVGGTSLSLDAAGASNNETPWKSGGGGYSAFVSQPNYQFAAQKTGRRGIPDVSYNADPNTGYPVYCSVPYEGSRGWSETGGTSAGAPQWAGLVAIANQMRADNHLGPLNGGKDTLPALYSLSDGPAFHDISQDGPSRSDPSSPGWDTATGLGTPQANQIVSVLSTVPTSTQAAPNSRPLDRRFNHHSVHRNEIVAGQVNDAPPVVRSATLVTSIAQTFRLIGADNANFSSPRNALGSLPDGPHAPSLAAAVTSSFTAASPTRFIYNVAALAQLGARSFVGRLPAIPAAADPAGPDVPDAMSSTIPIPSSPLTGMMLPLAAAGDFNFSSAGPAWELPTMACSFGVMLAGYWYINEAAARTRQNQASKSSPLQI